MRRSIGWACVCFVCAIGPASAASDYQWTFGANGLSDWRVTAVGSSAPATDPATRVYEGSFAANDPTINLILGKRYEITDSVLGLHFVEILAKSGSFTSDVVLLSEQPGITGSLEGDGGINWVDSGSGVVEFTVTQTLLDAMRQGGRQPGYRCSVHLAEMRGDFAIFGDGTEIPDPIAGGPPKGPETIELALVADALVSPLGVDQSDDPADDRLFIHDQAGKVWIVQGGALMGAPFLDVTSRLVALQPGYDERGLLGFAMHPDFASNPKVYTYTSEPLGAAADFTSSLAPGAHDHQSVVAEWQVSAGDANAIDPATRRELLRIDQPQGNHNGGTLRFGPDGMLYISLGDGGNANDVGPGHDPVHGNGQNPENVYGTLLRIDVDGNSAANGQYAIPADNPTTISSIREIWAYGFRNPYAFSFDRMGDGGLWLCDVGQADIEEVDRVEKAGNYGWNYKEGTFYFDSAGTFVTDVPTLPIPSGVTFIDPIAQFDHDEGIAIVCGFVYRGSALPSLLGRFVFGDFGQFAGANGRLFYLDAADTVREFQIGDDDRVLGQRIKGFGQDRGGEIYVCVTTNAGPSGTSGRVYRLDSLVSAADAQAWKDYKDPQ